MLSLVTACQPMVMPGVQQTTLMEQGQKTAEVTTAELRQILGDGATFVFDSRPHLEYSISHIPGSLNVAPKPGVELLQYVSDVAEIERVLTENGVQSKDAALVLYYADADVAEDCQVVDIPSGTVLRGPDGIKQLLLGFTTAFPDSRGEVTHMFATADHRVLKLARTIADLAQEESIAVAHLAEAIQYRPQGVA